jgi:hypothetical protein
MKERDIQKAIVNYIKLQYPNLLYCASAGGLRTSIKQARMMKATGYKKGFPDLAIFEPIETENSFLNFYFGLFLEIKTKKGRATKEQKWWCDELNVRNYYCKIVYGFEEAKETIDLYLKGELL